LSVIYVALSSESCVHSYSSISRYAIVWRTTIFISRVVLNILEGVSFFVTCHLVTENARRGSEIARLSVLSLVAPLSNERGI